MQTMHTLSRTVAVLLAVSNIVVGKTTFARTLFSHICLRPNPRAATTTHICKPIDIIILCCRQSKCRHRSWLSCLSLTAFVTAACFSFQPSMHAVCISSTHGQCSAVGVWRREPAQHVTVPHHEHCNTMHTPHSFIVFTVAVLRVPMRYSNMAATLGAWCTPA
jgi:hypothetical protein